MLNKCKFFFWIFYLTHLSHFYSLVFAFSFIHFFHFNLLWNTNVGLEGTPSYHLFLDWSIWRKRWISESFVTIIFMAICYRSDSLPSPSLLENKSCSRNLKKRLSKKEIIKTFRHFNHWNCHQFHQKISKEQLTKHSEKKNKEKNKEKKKKKEKKSHLEKTENKRMLWLSWNMRLLCLLMITSLSTLAKVRNRTKSHFFYLSHLHATLKPAHSFLSKYSKP